MEELKSARIRLQGGIVGDNRGRFASRAVTILSIEDWRKALAALNPPRPGLDWTTRRANLLVEGIRLPRSAGSRLRVGPVELEVTGQTSPCSRMEEQCTGLLKALSPDWRGGVTCRVLREGAVTLGDEVEIVRELPERPPPRLP